MGQLKKNNNLIATIVIGLIIGPFLASLSVNERRDCTAVGSKCYKLEKVQDERSRSQGLSGRESLDEDQGMLFVFSNLAKQCMWMRDMKFALDMVWLNHKGRVVYIEENVSPETYPRSFCSEDNAKHVIELNAGSVKASGLQLDDIVVIN